MAEGKIDISSMMRYSEIKTAWKPCSCGNPYCGKFINTFITYSSNNEIISFELKDGVGTVCNRLPKTRKLKQYIYNLFGIKG